MMSPLWSYPRTQSCCIIVVVVKCYTETVVGKTDVYYGARRRYSWMGEVLKKNIWIIFLFHIRVFWLVYNSSCAYSCLRCSPDYCLSSEANILSQLKSVNLRIITGLAFWPLQCKHKIMEIVIILIFNFFNHMLMVYLTEDNSLGDGRVIKTQVIIKVIWPPTTDLNK